MMVKSPHTLGCEQARTSIYNGQNNPQRKDFVMFKYIPTLLVFTFASQAAFAGDCVLNVTRQACPGKEEAAFKPYGGKPTSEEKKSADSADDCKALAAKAAKIVRKGTLVSKDVTAMFDGKPAGTVSEKSECN
jgi:hypothetical protein